MSDISISVDYDSSETGAVHLEVDIDGKPMLCSVWDFSIHCNEKKLRPKGEWTEVCTYHENGCDYLEIDMPLSESRRLQRFFLLDHKNRLLILGDTVLRTHLAATPARLSSAGAPLKLEYESKLLYSSDLIPKPTPDATEWTFFRKDRSVKRAKTEPFFRVLPLALPEWQDEMRLNSEEPSIEGSLKIEEAGLVLQQRIEGKSMFAPLFFDLDPERITKRYTWRRLSVGENLEKVPNDRAAGFRVQLDREQYLLYRSMTLPANRTVLGHNLIDDFCYARFDPQTGVEALVQLQQDFE